MHEDWKGFVCAILGAQIGEENQGGREPIPVCVFLRILVPLFFALSSPLATPRAFLSFQSLYFAIPTPTWLRNEVGIVLNRSSSLASAPSNPPAHSRRHILQLQNPCKTCTPILHSNYRPEPPELLLCQSKASRPQASSTGVCFSRASTFAVSTR